LRDVRGGPLLSLLISLALPGGATAASLPTGAPVRAAEKAERLKAKGGKAGAKIAKPRSPTVVLYHVNRKETLRLRLNDDRGRPVRGIRGAVDRFLRCHYTNRRHSIDARLIKLIYETGRNYPGRRIEVVSGYRHPKVAKNPRSPHMKGLACDMRVVGVKNTELRDFFRNRFRSVGVGYYPNSSFVHLDVRRGGASAFWIDYSGPGETALYSQNASEDLLTGRADRWRRTTIDPAWADEEEPVQLSSDAAGQSFAAPDESGADGESVAPAQSSSAASGR
jgi:uncharacterized protein YcbK (DUF882 family)